MTTQPQTVSSTPKGFSGGRMVASAAAVVAVTCLVVAGWSVAITSKGVSVPAPAPAPLTRAAIDDVIVTAPVLSGTPGDAAQALRLEHRILVAGPAKTTVSGTDGDAAQALRLEHRILVAGPAKTTVSGTDGDAAQALRLERMHGK